MQMRLFKLLAFSICCFAFSNIQAQTEERADSTSGAQTAKTEIAPVWDLKVGGALRFNYNLSTWKKNQVKRGGDIGYDVFRINVDARYKKLEIHVEQRFYSAEFGGAFLKYGWFQYPTSSKSHLKLGLIPAYFGTQQFNSHSWFFALPYYLGFEDDHDMGLSYSYTGDKWHYDLAFYKNAEELSFSDSGPISDSRYGYDISGDYKEVNTGTVRVIRTIKKGEVEHKVGATAQFGGLYGIDTKDIGRSSALGIHYQLATPKWSIKSIVLGYSNNGGPTSDRGIFSMSAYGAPYDTPAEAMIYTIGVARTFPVSWGPISSVQVYNDYNYMDKGGAPFEDTQMNVLGALVTAGPIYTYIDAAMGRNQPWLGPGFGTALGEGDPNAKWSTRFNINFGYYF
ncbi:MAG: hypothetical protein AB8F78_00205 [Saprospiraceae bacterium]